MVKEIFWIGLEDINFTKLAIRNYSILKLQIFKNWNSIMIEGGRNKSEKYNKSYMKFLLWCFDFFLVRYISLIFLIVHFYMENKGNT